MTDRTLTAADAIQLGISLAHFREIHAGTDRHWLRRFGFLRLWHAAEHRRRWGADYRYRHVALVAEAHECFRMERERTR